MKYNHKVNKLKKSYITASRAGRYWRRCIKFCTIEDPYTYAADWAIPDSKEEIVERDKSNSIQFLNCI